MTKTPVYTLKVSETFSAAHRLRGYKGQCENIHGHNWRVEVELRYRVLNDIGIAADFTDVKRLLKTVLSDYDHKDLNELREFASDNPSAEHIARNIHHKINAKAAESGIGVPERIRVSVYESERSCCSYEEEQ